jgi:hypothetical protein
MPRIPATYFVSIVDSRTGAWIGGQMGGGGGQARPLAERDFAKKRVEEAVRNWRRTRVECRDGVRPDFRGRPAFGCIVRGEEACYTLIDHNLFRMSCSGARTDSGRLVHRG